MNDEDWVVVTVLQVQIISKKIAFTSENNSLKKS